ncbi:MAG: Gfo/Idh/MocA family oxidoreductase [Anaerohalosphaera sp.]|nr:Gfo/Idh/MocA family oxidoreductase [Anaerohalosphaera sp.]
MALKQQITAEISKTINRRDFLAGAGGAAFSLSVLGEGVLASTKANSKIRLGMIGCGGRANYLGNLFVKHGGYEITAAADYFEDKADTLGDKYSVPKSKRFTKLSGYKHLLEQDVDAVVITSPPFFHPEHAKAAVEAGKHVYIAKPVAVDVPGCQTIKKSGEKATVKKLCFLVDFQTRANEYYTEAVRRVHNGALGKIAYGQCMYHGDRLGIKAPPGSDEARLRNWVFDKRLSGDIITEQNIHMLDVASWIMNTEPLYAVGTGGRKVRVDVGDCWDHFALLIQYPDDIGVTFSSRQFGAHGTPGGLKTVFFGSQGTIETEYGGSVLVRGKDFYRGGRTPQIYQEGAVTNIATFHKNIAEGNFNNGTVPASVVSNLVTIMGRKAAYEKRIVTWQETITSKERLDGGLEGLNV